MIAFTKTKRLAKKAKEAQQYHDAFHNVEKAIFFWQCENWPCSTMKNLHYENKTN